MEKPPTPRRRSSDTLWKKLPTPPPDPNRGFRPQENFKFSTGDANLPESFDRLLKAPEREENFYKLLNESITNDCEKLKSENENDFINQKEMGYSQTTVNRFPEYCALLRRECEEYIEPLHNRLRPSITAALAAYDAIEQLNRLHAMLDELCTIQEQIFQRKNCLKYVRELNEQKKRLKGEVFDFASTEELSQPDDDIDIEMNNNLLLNAMLAAGNSATSKRSILKRPRERSQSVITDEAGLIRRDKDNQYRRQSTYSEGKSKISKWTKVKAAFKWERANVPVLVSEDIQKPSLESAANEIGLTPINHEETKYLRVPSVPYGGGSSVDSIFSSSSGHAMSENGTPGYISPTSSIDEIDTSRLLIKTLGQKTDSFPLKISKPKRIALEENEKNGRIDDSHSNKTDSLSGTSASSAAFRPQKMQNLKSCQIGATQPDQMIIPRHEMFPTRSKLPPKPLNLNIKHDFNDSDSSNLLKSPRDMYSSVSSAINRIQKFQSPINSSVPSSPSKHSDFFPGFESEDISSGDISEPTTPYHMERIKFFQKQEEINYKYNILRERLNKEFESKRKNWEKIKTAYNGSSFTVTSPRYEEQPVSQLIKSKAATKFLEENLTPDFRKKLQKWRDKKPESLGGICSPLGQYNPLSKESQTKTKIDWNLWKTGQLKLEGQGLSPLPDQRDLPEEFKKKLEQWNNIKRGGIAMSNSRQSSLKRSTVKHGESYKRCIDDDGTKNRMEKLKYPEKDKPEKLSRLKAIVSEPRVKEIEVQTTAGVLKFEGISRKFTRKLYEWEKARGIGPESSTFALLHPGYCPIDVGNISKENPNQEKSPNFSRSLSLDSIAHNLAIAIQSISHQTSSLSLNNVAELKCMDGIVGHNAKQNTMDQRSKKFEEPEAVMVEVEDHIVETASSLLPIDPMFERHIPIYKYAEIPCNDYCNTKVQSFMTVNNKGQLIDTLNEIDYELRTIQKLYKDEWSNLQELHGCESLVAKIRNLQFNTKQVIWKETIEGLLAIVAQKLKEFKNVKKRRDQNIDCFKADLNNCDKELLYSLNEALKNLWKIIQNSRSNRDTIEDRFESTIPTNDDTSYNSQMINNNSTLEATDEMSASVDDVPSRNVNNGNTITAKRKFRFRKTDSRQNSRTESDSSDADPANLVDTPRRTRRKGCRSKQRSLDEDGEDISYGLKLMPGQTDPINIEVKNSYTQLLAVAPSNDILLATNNSNVFVQTKRKIFTTMDEPRISDGTAVVEKLLDTFEPNEYRNISAFRTVRCSRDEAIDSIDNQMVSKLGKALSLTQLQEKSAENRTNIKCIRQCYGSYESIGSKHSYQWIKFKNSNNVKIPLATDSFRLLSKNQSLALSYNPILKSCSKKEHLFKKNIEKYQKSSGNAIKKIENKIAKFASAVDYSQYDNTMPKISRKLKNKPMDPVFKQTFEYSSEPASFGPINPQTLDKPRTPLSERARRIQLAKEEFLKGTLPKINYSFEQDNNENWSCLRRSHHNVNSEIDDNNSNLLKSQSVGILGIAAATSTDVTDSDINAYDSLPRTVSRSEKITSKLGFATIASKLRRVSIRRRKDSPSNGNSALGALCKQSLTMDLLTIPSNLSDGKNIPVSENLTKSKSLYSAAISRNEVINKSKSDQYIQTKKESYV